MAGRQETKAPATTTLDRQAAQALMPTTSQTMRQFGAAALMAARATSATALTTRSRNQAFLITVGMSPLTQAPIPTRSQPTSTAAATPTQFRLRAAD